MLLACCVQWTEAMQIMVAGDKWELYIPSELAYGEAGAGNDIGPGDALIFTLHLLSVNGQGTPALPSSKGSKLFARHGGMGGHGSGGKRRGSADAQNTGVVEHKAKNQELR